MHHVWHRWAPIRYSWRLNERHYGALQGQHKAACSDRYGVRQVQKNACRWHACMQECSDRYGVRQVRPPHISPYLPASPDRYGVRQVQKWRRGVSDAPPPWDDDLKTSTLDRRYAGVPQAIHMYD